MKKKTEIRSMLKEYEHNLENTKTEIANIAMNGDLELEEKHKKLIKIEPVYQSYVVVVDVLKDILEVDKVDIEENEIEETE